MISLNKNPEKSFVKIKIDYELMGLSSPRTFFYKWPQLALKVNKLAKERQTRAKIALFCLI